MRKWAMDWFEKAMTLDEVNSRMVFLAHGLASAVCLVVLTVAFVCQRDKTDYAIMAGAVGGSGAAAAWGRMQTKKDGDR